MLKLLSGVLGTSHINKTKAEKEAKAKLDKYLAKDISSWDFTFLK